jgi:monofunctional biosynthetic peptidoglycan transglycosylase
MNRALLIAGAVAAAILLLVLGVVLVSGIAASLPDVRALARRVPARTALMRQRSAEGRADGRPVHVDQRWVSYSRISPLLRRAVLIAEDDAFFSHDGLDWDEIRASVRRNLAAGRVVRGGSTITQQLARNLYLGTARTPTRKLKEVLLARRIEGALSKRRIFELYLNLIEWGDGVYGIEAAARRHFGVPAERLDARQSALLAAVIINPRRYDPAHPGRRIERRARMILTRMWRRGQLSETEYLAAVGRAPQRPALLRWLFGSPADTPAPEPTSPPEPDSSPTEPDTTGLASDSLPS